MVTGQRLGHRQGGGIPGGRPPEASAAKSDRLPVPQKILQTLKTLDLPLAGTHPTAARPHFAPAITVDADGDTPGDESRSTNGVPVGRSPTRANHPHQPLHRRCPHLPEDKLLALPAVQHRDSIGGSRWSSHPESEMERLYGKAQQAGWNISKTSALMPFIPAPWLASSTRFRTTSTWCR